VAGASVSRKRDAASASPIGALLDDVDRLRAVVRRVRTPQIWSEEDRGHIRAVATAWFQSYQTIAVGRDVGTINEISQWLLTAAERAPSTTKVSKRLKQLRAQLISLQTQLIASPSPSPAATDTAPLFGAVPDPEMQKVLVRRWNECVACLGAGAPMAATVMMGGLLETLFLARINREPNQAAIFTAKTAPKDKNGAPRPLNQWGLKDYIAVSHELKWITQSGKDVSAVLQNYRNYIHPTKELSGQSTLVPDDARMFWAVFKAIAARLL